MARRKQCCPRCTPKADPGGNHLSCVRCIAGSIEKPTFVHHSERLPVQGSLFIRQSEKFIEDRVCCRVISAVGMGYRCDGQRVHQRGSLTDVARILEWALFSCECGLGIAERPQGERPPPEGDHTDVLAKSRRQRTMLGRIIKRDRLIVVGPAFREGSPTRQGSAHEAMPDRERQGCPLLLSERQELRRKLTHRITAERHKIRGPEAIENRK